MKKILHFENDKILAEIYRATFKKAEFGYQRYAKPPQTKKGLINLILEQNPDIIISDVIHSGIDGFEMIKILKNNKLTKDIPFVFLTNISQSEEISKGKKLGAIDYLVKADCVPNKIAEIIKKHLNIE